MVRKWKWYLLTDIRLVAASPWLRGVGTRRQVAIPISRT